MSMARMSQGPVHVVKVHGLAEVSVRLQQAHDDRHGRLVAAQVPEACSVQVQLRAPLWRRRQSKVTEGYFLSRTSWISAISIY